MAITIDLVPRIVINDAGHQEPAQEFLIGGALLQPDDLLLGDFPTPATNRGLILPCEAAFAVQMSQSLMLNAYPWVGIFHWRFNTILIIAAGRQTRFQEGEIVRYLDSVRVVVNVGGLDEQIDGGEGF